MKNENLILAGLVAIAGGVIIYKKVKKSKGETATETPVTTPTNPETTPAPTVTLNGNLLLKMGSKGNEVKQLQKLVGVSQDGVFGTKTEVALFKLKGVKQITLNTFSNVATVNQTALAIGQSVMAGTSGATLIASQLAADGLYYTTNTVYKKIDFGQKIGKIVATTVSKNKYLVDYITFLGSVKVWVSASEVKKI